MSVRYYKSSDSRDQYSSFMQNPFFYKKKRLTQIFVVKCPINVSKWVTCVKVTIVLVLSKEFVIVICIVISLIIIFF